jgi:RNA polymerase sigma-70 factor (ECF subfamily)
VRYVHRSRICLSSLVRNDDDVDLVWRTGSAGGHPASLDGALTPSGTSRRSLSGVDTPQLIARPTRLERVGADPDDATLVARAVGGDDLAFDMLATRYRKVIWASCAAVCQDVGATEEAVVDALSDLWLGLATFRGESRLSTWIYRVSRHAALRGRTARRPVPVDPATMGDTSDDATARLDETLLDRTVVRQALRLIPAEQARALVLHIGYRLSIKEVADLEGMSEDGIKSRVQRGLKAIASQMKQVDHD